MRRANAAAVTVHRTGTLFPLQLSKRTDYNGPCSGAVTRPAKLYVFPAILAEYRNVLSRPDLQIRKGIFQPLLQPIENTSACGSGRRTCKELSFPQRARFPQEFASVSVYVPFRLDLLRLRKR